MQRKIEAIARGEHSPDEAREVITELKEKGLEAADVYSSLLRLVWVATTERRADSDLRKWHRLIRDTRCMFSDEKYNERFEALADLLRISVSRPEPEDFRNVYPIREILELLSRNPDLSMHRTNIAQSLGINKGHVLNRLPILIFNGLVEREKRSVEPCYKISAKGLNLLQEWAIDENTPGV